MEVDYLIGQIALFPYGFAPRGWMLCNGQLLQVSQNNALYSLLGSRFGGNDKTTFAIPNLQGAEPQPGTAYYICTAGLYPAKE